MNLLKIFKTKLFNSEFMENNFYKYNSNANYFKSNSINVQNAFNILTKELKYSLSFDKQNNNSKLSIIIPVFNNFEYTMACLFSIKCSIHNIDYEIIIADDNSTDETKKIEKYVQGITHIRNDRQMGFLENVNNAVKSAKGEYIVLLNNDMILQDNCVNEMLKTVENDKSIGICGAEILNIDGKIQETGGKILKNGDTLWINNQKNQNDIECQNLIECDYCSGCSILLKKTNWEKIGGFDSIYAPAYYEDTDLCMKVRYDLNLRVVCEPRAKIYHFHNISYKSKMNDLINHNKIKFYNKWKDKWKNKD